MKKLLNFIFLLAMIACNAQSSSSIITAVEFKEKIESIKNVQIVDVRTPQEIKNGYIKGARFIDINNADFRSNISQLDKSRPVLVYCAAGGRSANAAKYLEKEGFKEVYDLQGGFGAWRNNNFPVEK